MKPTSHDFVYLIFCEVFDNVVSNSPWKWWETAKILWVIDAPAEAGNCHPSPK